MPQGLDYVLPEIGEVFDLPSSDIGPCGSFSHFSISSSVVHHPCFAPMCTANRLVCLLRTNGAAASMGASSVCCACTAGLTVRMHGFLFRSFLIFAFHCSTFRVLAVLLGVFHPVVAMSTPREIAARVHRNQLLHIFAAAAMIFDTRGGCRNHHELWRHAPSVYTSSGVMVRMSSWCAAAHRARTS